jgi:hypothetical protein
MGLIGIVIAAAVLAAVGYWWQSRRRPPRDMSRSTETVARRFAGVEIRVGSASCDAARALAGQRFLANQAPELPLADCKETRCRCSFAKLSDRREESRRWADDGVSAPVFNAAERRNRLDRRQSD